MECMGRDIYCILSLPLILCSVLLSCDQRHQSFAVCLILQRLPYINFRVCSRSLRQGRV